MLIDVQQTSPWWDTWFPQLHGVCTMVGTKYDESDGCAPCAVVRGPCMFGALTGSHNHVTMDRLWSGIMRYVLLPTTTVQQLQ